MKKQILELLKELEELGIVYPRVMFYKDSSGCVFNNYENKTLEWLFYFSSEQELIKGLKDKIKELKNG